MKLFLLSREPHNSPLYKGSSQLTAVSTTFFFLSIMVLYFFFFLTSVPLLLFSLSNSIFPHIWFLTFRVSPALFLKHLLYSLILLFLGDFTNFYDFNYYLIFSIYLSDLSYLIYLKRWVGKLQLIVCFCPGCKMVFICLNNWKEIQGKIIFHDTWSLYVGVNAEHEINHNTGLAKV